jgi:ABC-type branched-subunit amino acid transport system permease subunit
VTPSRRHLAVALLAGLLLLIPLALPRYPRFVASLSLVNAIAAMGVNLSMGYAGAVSVGHAGFAGIGAYTTALLMGKLGWPLWIVMPVSALVAAFVGCLIGIPALKLNPLYISMVTFGFGQVVSYVTLNWIALTNGPNGLTVPPAELFGYVFSPESFYYPIALCFALMLWIARNLVRSRMGRAFIAIRDGELAAQAMGIHLAKYKTVAFAVGAFYGGLAGSLYAGLSEFVNPDAFVFSVSILYLTMNVVGGIGTLAGPVVGAVVFTVLPELLRPFAEYKEFIAGALLLAFLVFLPTGIVGLARGIRLRRWRRAPTAPLPAQPTA